jgi:hypothetical protein
MPASVGIVVGDYGDAFDPRRHPLGERRQPVCKAANRADTSEVIPTLTGPGSDLMM